MAYDHFTVTVTHRLLTLTHKMKSFVAILALVAVAAADVSHINVKGPDADAQVVEQDANVLPDQYQYGYKTSNGIAGVESGVLKNIGKDGEAISVQGYNTYTAPDGTPIRIEYTADETGYHPSGDHLPTPPAPQEIPEYIQRSIAYIAAHPPPPESIRRA